MTKHRISAKKASEQSDSAKWVEIQSRRITPRQESYYRQLCNLNFKQS